MLYVQTYSSLMRIQLISHPRMKGWKDESNPLGLRQDSLFLVAYYHAEVQGRWKPLIRTNAKSIESEQSY